MKKNKLNYPVFFFSAFVILVVTFFASVFPQAVAMWLAKIQASLVHYFSVYYLIVVSLYLAFVIFLACSPYGKIKLGRDDEQPVFSYSAWAGMLFSSGIGVSLLYFGASEPLTHLLNPPVLEDPTIDAPRQAMVLTFLHWGFHGWAIYALVGVVLAYFAYRHQQPLALRTALYPLIGKRVEGVAGHTVDCFGILITVLGLVSNLAIGALQISAGLEHIFDLTHSTSQLFAVIVIITMLATFAAISGVEVGIRWLSNLNIVLFAALLLFFLGWGPTSSLVSTLGKNIGDYAVSFLGKSFSLYFTSSATWMGKWTLFYWAWWISWAPFVGLFIARISRGRSIREVVLGVLLLPLLFTLIWLSVLGNSVFNLLNHETAFELSQIVLTQPALILYKLLAQYPWGGIAAGLAVFVSLGLFVTPADSGAVMLANLSMHDQKSTHDAPRWLRIFWAILIMLCTLGLMFANNINAIQSAIVLASLPFSWVLLVYMLCMLKSLRTDIPLLLPPRVLAKTVCSKAKRD